MVPNVQALRVTASPLSASNVSRYTEKEVINNFLTTEKNLVYFLRMKRLKRPNSITNRGSVFKHSLISLPFFFSEFQKNFKNVLSICKGSSILTE